MRYGIVRKKIAPVNRFGGDALAAETSRAVTAGKKAFLGRPGSHRLVETFMVGPFT